MNFDLLAISKVKSRSNRIYQKLVLLLPGEINLNPGLVNRYHIREHKLGAKNYPST